MRPGRPSGHGRRPDQGSASIELAILFPIFVVLIMLGVQVALVFSGRNVALAAAQLGAAAESAYGAEPGAGESRAAGYLNRMGDLLTDWEIAVTPVAEDGDEPTAVRVTVTGDALSWFGLDLTVSQTAYAGLERFTTEDEP
ncbi:pilus assembly protein [Solwaraspora sp. WMMD1047]|uniref:TadE family protein n=1 Tax=Solwaraspora sp. WMMD1047 TaxID=3016102 RepID=UPI002415E6F8|nr:TadE family protein [Solwaraspora sp. WMMD1047]MDG4833006.1 pilus assembly protein [Solwaraspora sp. WMMD1047]